MVLVVELAEGGEFDGLHPTDRTTVLAVLAPRRQMSLILCPHFCPNQQEMRMAAAAQLRDHLPAPRIPGACS